MGTMKLSKPQVVITTVNTTNDSMREDLKNLNDRRSHFVRYRFQFVDAISIDELISGRIEKPNLLDLAVLVPVATIVFVEKGRVAKRV
jgi:transposase-like protein